ncbi:uncharacterized protein V1518DRAFT_414032 [Limtongia smithiae]|uniref:uncharacterized protein n=1 Tax=Limtongia smithiae TaxID=1125753 RepID=UPI0034CD819F
MMSLRVSICLQEYHPRDAARSIVDPPTLHINISFSSFYEFFAAIGFASTVMSPPRGLAIIAGFGPGISLGLARRFARSYDLVVLGRSLNALSSTAVGSTSPTSATHPDALAELLADANLASLSPPPKVTALIADVSNTDSITQAFAEIKKLNQPVVAALYNVSAPFTRKPFLEAETSEYVTAFNSSVMGAVLFSQQVLPLLIAAAPGAQLSPSLIFTGATASYKANAQMSVFTTGKWALRSLAQSLAREFAPEGVHVATVNIDGIVDMPKTKGYLNEFPDQKISPGDVAETYWDLHAQRRSAWTWEVDVRPWLEKW